MGRKLAYFLAYVCISQATADSAPEITEEVVIFLGMAFIVLIVSIVALILYRRRLLQIKA
jgi:hypothetical protein